MDVCSYYELSADRQSSPKHRATAAGAGMNGCLFILRYFLRRYYSDCSFPSFCLFRESVLSFIYSSHSGSRIFACTHPNSLILRYFLRRYYSDCSFPSFCLFRESVLSFIYSSHSGSRIFACTHPNSLLFIQSLQAPFLSPILLRASPRP